ncbi:MAG: class I SAM-dependent methyltransferase [Akkermansiaceae bacterium]|nr:class I SAM-dependent methyltransferase [Armatimonadota bacterium]
MSQRSTVEQIRARFDADVERFSKRETGQTALMDAVLALDLIADAALAVTPNATDILDIGCGAGNFSLALLERLPNRNVTLNDLSEPMLTRASERVSAATTGSVLIARIDIREWETGDGAFDIIVAGSVLHHLRTDSEWEAVFAKLFAALRPGGSLWVSDLVESSHPGVQAQMWDRYGSYLAGLNGEAYRDKVFAYIAKEDTPRPLWYQLDLLRRVGFAQVEILHKNAVSAAFGGVKAVF